MKERIFGVGAYYLLQNPGKDYWAGWNTVAYWPSLENNEKMWSHALEVDIGMPTGHTPDGATVISPWGVWTFATGADPGHPDYPDINKSRYKIYAREYTKGLVLLKPRSGTATYPGSRSADNTATTHNLSSTTDNPTGRYYQVKDDGTIDTTPLTTITLRNGEAAILIKESAINDTTPPTISNVRNSTITNSSAIILWNTDESSNSAVYYGTTTTLGQQKSDANLMVAHSIQLTGLTPITFYYYKASSCDATGNCANSSLQNFTTLAIAQQCIENWTCTQWSACINKTQTRTCTDLSNCGTTNNKPTETRRCGNFTKIKIKGNLKFSTGQACSSCDITITFIDSTSSATTDSSGYFELTLQPSTPFAAMSYIINGTVKHQLTEIKFKRTISIV
ncbi:fibronectin type III domain-containing protein [Candidatus Pacearchaeota archaeon]|nr:fibronectin type III domain-containing protein [Candidatus Pacearchaeota archaeon]